MILHPRFVLVQAAKPDLSLAIMGVLKKHDLTYLEAIGLLSEEISSLVKYAIRVERHGTTERSGDEAPDEKDQEEEEEEEEEEDQTPSPRPFPT